MGIVPFIHGYESVIPNQISVRAARKLPLWIWLTNQANT